jgi:glycosyltransferase involved in cell wall biosynthesis
VKVLLFIHSLAGGGAERVSAHLANHWVSRGINLTVVTLAPITDDRYALDPAIVRVSLGETGTLGGVFEPILANARRVGRLRKVLVEQEPDVALSMMSTANVLLALAAIGLRDVRTFGSERVHPTLVPIGRAWEFLRRVCYGLLDGVVAQTVKTRDWILAHTTASRVVAIPNPVVWPMESRPPQVTPASVGSSGRKRILGVGRLEYQKGFDILLETFASVANDLPDWELAIVGEGKERASLQARISGSHLSQRAFLVGDIGNIGDWYESADLFVFPSRFEGFPNALAEAMASGMAVISFDCDTGPRDLIRNGVDGLLIPDGDIAGLVDAMRSLMGDGAARAQLGSRAVDVRKRFAIERVSQLWLEFFAGASA